MTPETFVQRYKHATVNEKGAAQSHFMDLCQLLGVPTPMEADPEGNEYRFEKPVLKVTGGSGFADIWKRGAFGWEYKGKGKDLNRAYQQLLTYREDLENPPLLVVCDMQTIRVHTNFTGTQKHVEEYDLEDLLKEETRQRLRLLWTALQEFNPARAIELATVAAVESLAKISDALKKEGEDPEETAHFLIRVMFTLFAEDVGLLPKQTFTRLLKAALQHPEDFSPMCQELFEAMKVGRLTMQGRIPYINGGVFEATQAPNLDRTALNRLHDAAQRNWSKIDPIIFGTLFELVIDPEKRWQLGAHYTPLADILDVVEPVIFVPLRKEWETVRAEIQPMLHQIEENRAASGDLFTQQAETEQLTKEVVERLKAFQQRLASVRVMDPAMGSGNFLYVSLRLLLDLELEVRQTIRAVTLDQVPAAQVSPQQLLGMEVNAYAHEIAGMVLHIGYLQWLSEHGEKREVSPVLRSLPGLKHCDAVMDGPAAREWPEAEFIVGNPPFLGYSPMRQQLGGVYVDKLRGAYSGKIPGQSDFVCYFFEQARENVATGRTSRVGLIATNSIGMGENARVLERINESGSIFAAWPDRAWIQSGAAVRTAIVMFDDGSQTDKALLLHEGDERDPKRRRTIRTEVGAIHVDLCSGPDLRSAAQLSRNAGRSFIGVIPGSKHFLLSKQDAQNMQILPNPESHDNSAVIRPFKVGKDVNGHDAQRYIIDFSGLTQNLHLNRRTKSAPRAEILEVCTNRFQGSAPIFSHSGFWTFQRRCTNGEAWRLRCTFSTVQARRSNSAKLKEPAPVH